MWHVHAGDNHGWAIAVGVILGVALLALIALAAILLRRKRQREEVCLHSAYHGSHTVHLKHVLAIRSYTAGFGDLC